MEFVRNLARITIGVSHANYWCFTPELLGFHSRSIGVSHVVAVKQSTNTLGLCPKPQYSPYRQGCGVKQQPHTLTRAYSVTVLSMVRLAEMLTRSHSLRSLAHAASQFAIDMPSTHKKLLGFHMQLLGFHSRLLVFHSRHHPANPYPARLPKI
jgi:hypothetical protein